MTYIRLKNVINRVEDAKAMGLHPMVSKAEIKSLTKRGIHYEKLLKNTL